MAARALRIPSSTTFDYEFATAQHQLGCRAANVVLVPEAIPPGRLERYGVRYPNVRDPDTSVLKDYGGLPIPRTYVIGRDWVVSGYIYGETREETLRSAIEEALAT